MSGRLDAGMCFCGGGRWEVDDAWRAPGFVTFCIYATYLQPKKSYYSTTTLLLMPNHNLPYPRALSP